MPYTPARGGRPTRGASSKITLDSLGEGDWDGGHSLRRTQRARISDPKQYVHAAKVQPNYIAPNIRVRSSHAKRCNTLLWLRWSAPLWCELIAGHHRL